jgi:hypothetical protein
MTLAHMDRMARYFPHMTEHFGAFPFGDEMPVKESPTEFIARTLAKMLLRGEIASHFMREGVSVVNDRLEIHPNRQYHDIVTHEVGNYRGTLRTFILGYTEKLYLGDCDTCAHCALRWPKDLMIDDQHFGRVDPLCGTFLRNTEQGIPVEYTLPLMREQRDKAMRLWREKKIEGRYFRVKITRYDGRGYLKPIHRYVRAPHPSLAKAMIEAQVHDAQWQAAIGEPKEARLKKILDNDNRIIDFLA